MPGTPRAPRSTHFPRHVGPSSLSIVLIVVLTLMTGTVGAAVNAGPDFDGDGFGDLAVGVMNESLGAYTGIGAVHVIYGSVTGLNGAGSQLFSPLTVGLTALDGGVLAYFGRAITWGDYNGDDYDDLAVSASNGMLRPTQSLPGVVYVLFGSSTGLKTQGHQVITLDNIGGAGDIGEGQFGSSLASGDFNGDGYADLVIGTPEAQFDLSPSAPGALHVLRGSAQGVRRTSAVLWSQDSAGIWNTCDSYDFFSRVLAVGDFDGDGYDDLAIGVSESLADVDGAGAVNVLYGSASGLSASRDQFWHQNSGGVADSCETSDGFGRSLAAGDFNGDGRDDLAIGVPGETLRVSFFVEPIQSCGALHVLYGSANGLSATGSEFWWLGNTGMPTPPRSLDAFANDLAAADFDADGRDDLAVGIAQSNVVGTNAGAVVVMYGQIDGLRAGESELFTQNTEDIAETAEPNDYFGSTLAVGNFDNIVHADLVIGVSSEGNSIKPRSGVVHVLYGDAHGLGNISQLWHQGSLNIADSPEANDSFSSSLCR